MTQGRYIGAPAFGLFGLACGSTLALAAQAPPKDAAWKIGLVAVAVAWCTALSIGYNTPALATGIVATFLLHLWFPRPTRLPGVRQAAVVLIGIVSAWCLWAFDQARMKFVYLEGPARQLIWRLDGVLPGGAGLQTDRNTYLVLRDLRTITSVEGRRYAILSDFAGWWPAAEQSNPLPVDWPQWIELGSPQLRQRAIAALDAQRGKLDFVVPRFDTWSLAKGFTPAPNSFRYPLAAHVRTHYTKVGETPFFEVYR